VERRGARETHLRINTALIKLLWCDPVRLPKILLLSRETPPKAPHLGHLDIKIIKTILIAELR
jgi:hypothetical protein